MKSQRISVSVPAPVKKGVQGLMEVFGQSESAVAARLIEEGVKRYTPKGGK